MSANQAANLVRERALDHAGQTVLSRTTDLMRALEGLVRKIGLCRKILHNIIFILVYLFELWDNSVVKN